MALQFNKEKKESLLKRELSSCNQEFLRALGNAKKSIHIEGIEKLLKEVETEMSEIKVQVIEDAPDLTVSEISLLKKITELEQILNKVKKELLLITKLDEEMKETDLFNHFYQLTTLGMEISEDKNDYWQLFIMELISAMKEIESDYIKETRPKIDDALVVKSYPYAQLLCQNVIKLQNIQDTLRRAENP